MRIKSSAPPTAAPLTSALRHWRWRLLTTSASLSCPLSVLSSMIPRLFRRSYRPARFVRLLGRGHFFRDRLLPARCVRSWSRCRPLPGRGTFSPQLIPRVGVGFRVVAQFRGGAPGFRGGTLAWSFANDFSMRFGFRRQGRRFRLWGTGSSSGAAGAGVSGLCGTDSTSGWGSATGAGVSGWQARRPVRQVLADFPLEGEFQRWG